MVHLQNHPLMVFRGYSVWPPIWVDHTGTSESIPSGEVGVLRQVRCYPDNPRRIFLTMEYEGKDYTGCLLMEYEFSCESIVKLLEGCTGLTMEAIGSLEMPLAFGTCRKAHTGQ